MPCSPTSPPTTPLADCRDCPRLAGFLAQVKADNPDYYCKPVMPFGAENPRLLIVGLAPGMHGANRSGRPFTGDHAGILLYETLHTFGFASRPVSVSADDGLELIGCRITNAVKCLPPANKPETAEIRQCNHHLKAELVALRPGTALLALGNVAHVAVLMALGLKAKAHAFAHAAAHDLPGNLRLYDSYHCSRYNTQTRRLTPDMFRSVFARIKNDLGE
ncbi:uracil-DNA glycosylase [Betaproteobacteria bacterium SCN2]|nr:uracil-DNA glycosylase [Betaproteobacteria bacterium SCN2]